MSTPLFRSGALILQDLASCFPAAVLSPPCDAGVYALDATSAPGNKTSHLSALMHGNGSLIALERAPARYKTLERMLARAGCLADAGGNVSPQKHDFLAVEPTGDYERIQYMLLDPSCSGSGIVNRLDYLTGNDDEQDNLEQIVPDERRANSHRLAALAALQQRMIRHAMTFPHLVRFTYSTCSVHEEENEQVVAAALASPEAAAGGWRLAPRADVLPTWPVRGRPEACDAALAECMVRCTPGGCSECAEGVVSAEATNGFFVACFVRHGAAGRPSVDAKRPAEADSPAPHSEHKRAKTRR